MSARVEIGRSVAPGSELEFVVGFDDAIRHAEIVVEWFVSRFQRVDEAKAFHREPIEEPRAAGALHATRIRLPLVPTTYHGRQFSIGWRVVVRATLEDGGEETTVVDFDVK